MSHARHGLRVAVGLAVCAAVMAGTAIAAIDGKGKDTRADFTPFERFTPLSASADRGAPVDDPFVLPDGYEQLVVAREGDGGTTDLWDMNTQNESGKDAGRYVYRTHEVGGAGQLSVTDLETGTTTVLATRPHWERLDGIAWTPW